MTTPAVSLHPTGSHPGPAAVADSSPDVRAYRLTALDAVRGAVVVVMALDHVREMLLQGATFDPSRDPHASPALFFTRWITHFCAPVFVFLAGLSAGLMRRRRTPAAVGRLLLTRGLWLLVVEVGVISPAITLDFGGPPRVLLQVLYAIGGGMIILAGVQFLGRRPALLLGAAVVLLHNALDPVWPAAGSGSDAPWWVSLHRGLVTTWDGWRIIWAYPLLPWVGVICLGFGAAPLFELPPDRRRRALLGWGWGLTLGFVLLRAVNGYGDPYPWHLAPEGPLGTLQLFLAAGKYPPSLLYLAMTLGPAALLCAWADRLPAWLTAVLTTYGRAPFAFYVAHFYLARAAFFLVGTLQGFTGAELVNPAGHQPPGFGLPLAGVYAVWVLVVALLYPFCRWVGTTKARRSDWWLSYL